MEGKPIFQVLAGQVLEGREADQGAIRREPGDLAQEGQVLEDQENPMQAGPRVRILRPKG